MTKTRPALAAANWVRYLALSVVTAIILRIPHSYHS